MNSKTKITKEEVLLALAKSGDPGMTSKELFQQVTKLKKLIEQEAYEIAEALLSLEDDGEIWHDETNEDGERSIRFHFEWDRQRDS
ncbi:MAG: hypothetical protein IK105_07270 [Thermoguttaceae bacterium]|nr:hypothetical protein [Thermoguttaceae bacterium]